MSWKYYAVEALKYLPLAFVVIMGWYFFVMFKSAETLHWLFSSRHDLRRRTANIVLFFTFFISQFVGLMVLLQNLPIWRAWDSTISMIIIGVPAVMVSGCVASVLLGSGHYIAAEVDKRIRAENMGRNRR